MNNSFSLFSSSYDNIIRVLEGEERENMTEEISEEKMARKKKKRKRREEKLKPKKDINLQVLFLPFFFGKIFI